MSFLRRWFPAIFGAVLLLGAVIVTVQPGQPKTPAATPDTSASKVAAFASDSQSLSQFVVSPTDKFPAVPAGQLLTRWSPSGTNHPVYYWTDSSGQPVLLQLDALRGMLDYHPGILVCVLPKGLSVADVQHLAQYGANGYVVGARAAGSLLSFQDGAAGAPLELRCEVVVATTSVIG